MPTPEQSRLTIPGTMGLGTMGQNPSSVDRARDVALERAFNRLPFFVDHDRRFQFPAEETVLTSTDPVDMVFDTDGVFDIEFEKYETWTDVKVRVAMSGFSSVAGVTVVIQAVITDQTGIETTVPTIARFHHNDVNLHLMFQGERRVSALLPGRYTLTFQWSVSNDNFRFDERDTIYGSVIECLPVPTF